MGAMNRFQDWTAEDLLALDRETEVQRRELGIVRQLVSETIFGGSYQSVFADQPENDGSDWIGSLIVLRRRHDVLSAEIRAIADLIRPPQEEIAA